MPNFFHDALLCSHKSQFEGITNENAPLRDMKGCLICGETAEPPLQTRFAGLLV